MVGGQVRDVFGTKPRHLQGQDQPLRRERFASRRTDGYPVAQRERLRPQPVDTGTVAGGVHGEHLAAPRPYRAAMRMRSSRQSNAEPAG